jgi:hypothetical protein
MLFTEPFWYYIMLIVVSMILVWYIVLQNYCCQRWANKWIYSTNNIVSLTGWSLSIIVFMYGAYQSDIYDTIGPIVTLFRLLFGVIVFVNLLAVFLFYFVHDVIGALISYIYCLILIIGLIFLYTPYDILNAWLLIPYMLIIIYYIYSLLYIYNNNVIIYNRDTLTTEFGIVCGLLEAGNI